LFSTFKANRDSAARELRDRLVQMVAPTRSEPGCVSYEVSPMPGSCLSWARAARGQGAQAGCVKAAVQRHEALPHHRTHPAVRLRPRTTEQGLWDHREPLHRKGRHSRDHPRGGVADHAERREPGPEEALDVESVHIAAPNAKVVLVGADCDPSGWGESPLALQGYLDAATRVVGSHLADPWVTGRRPRPHPGGWPAAVRSPLRAPPRRRPGRPAQPRSWRVTW
jgi:hypothetical protein